MISHCFRCPQGFTKTENRVCFQICCRPRGPLKTENRLFQKKKAARAPPLQTENRLKKMIPARGPQTRFVMYIWCKKVFMRLSSLDIWAWVCRLGGTRLSTGASREASVSMNV